jgi:uncharacterized protein (TIGR03437 family)
MKNVSSAFGRVSVMSLVVIVVLSQLSSATRTISARRVNDLDHANKASRLREADPAAKHRVSESYGRLPLSFEANEGQFDPRVKFTSRGSGYALSLAQTEIALSLSNGGTGASFGLRMKFEKANTKALIEGVDLLPGRSNYLIGNDRARWRTGVANYAKVRYGEIYRGIDLDFYGHQQRLEYDLIVKPGADPRAIHLSFDGVDSLRLDRNGDLVLGTPGGEVRQLKPVIYQEINGERRVVSGGYTIRNPQSSTRNGRNLKVGFSIARYDRGKPLVIDPVLVYSTLLGGRIGDFANAVAVDADGNAYVTGRTTSPDFPARGPLESGVSRDTIFKSANGGTNWSGAGRQIAGFSVNQLAIDPKNPSTLYAVTERGLHKSADGGGAWTMLRADFTGALAIDPVNPNTLYTGEKLQPEPGRVFKSADGGGSWVELNGIPSDATYAIAVDPVNPATVYVGTGKGLYKSTDGGGNWNLRPFCEPGVTPCRSFRVNAVAVDPRNPARVYAGVDGRMFITDNGGGEWIQIFNQVTPFDIRAIAIDSSSSVYVVNGNFTPGLLIKSYDAGRNWVGLGIRARSLAIDPRNPANLYAGFTNGLLKSVSGGADWTNVSAGTSRRPVNSIVVDPANPAQVYAGASGPASDVFVAKLNPQGSALLYVAYLGGSGGDDGVDITVDSSGNAYVAVAGKSNDFPLVNSMRGIPLNSFFTSSDGGGNWVAGPSLPDIRAFAVDALTLTTRIYAATGRGLFANIGSSWGLIGGGLPHLPVTAVAVDPRNSGTIYAAVSTSETSGAVYKATNLGVNWNKLDAAPAGRVNSLAIDPNNSVTIYAALNQDASFASGGVAKSSDGGATWIRLTNGLTSTAHGQTAALGIRLIAVDPTDSSVLYAATFTGLGITPPTLRKSADGGNTWTATNLVTLVNSLVIDPLNPSTLYAASGFIGAQMGVVKTTNGGSTWQRVWPELPGNPDPNIVALAIDPKNPSTLYAAVSNPVAGGPLKNGVYKTVDGGATWKSSSIGLPEAGVVALAIDPNSPSRLYASLAPSPAVAETESFVDHSFVVKLNPAGSEIVYSTYITETIGAVGGIAVDASGSAYLAGASLAGFLKTTANAVQPNPRGQQDAFIVKLNPAGSEFVYSTYLGGSNFDAAASIAIDGAGNAYLVGVSIERDFPTTPGSYRPATDDFSNVWVAKLNASGTSLLYSTYLAAQADIGDIAVDAAGAAYVTGAANSPRFPVTSGAFQQNYLGSGIIPGGGDAFVAKLSADGSALVYSTLLGGRGNDSGAAIAIDAMGNAVVAGMTRSNGFPVTADAVQAVADGGVCGMFRFDPRSQPVPVACSDAFLTKLNADGSALIYSTYLGGKPADDVARGLALDASGAVYIAGYTNAANFPTSQNAVQAATLGASDSFVLKIEIGARAATTLTSVSAANYRGAELAPESIVAAFGSRLATSTATATSDPLPTSLAGTTVRVRDSAGMERFAPLFFVSEGQVNYQMPTGTAPGNATVIIANENNVISTGGARIVEVAPGLFTANASGQGLPAALAQRLRDNTTVAYEPVARFDTMQNRFVPVPIDLGPEGDQVYLVLFGTGFRRRSALSAVSVKIGGVDVTINYAGPQLQLVGLDQINALIPRSFIGRGEVDVMVAVDGKAANPVHVSIK